SAYDCRGATISADHDFVRLNVQPAYRYRGTAEYASGESEAREHARRKQRALAHPPRRPQPRPRRVGLDRLAAQPPPQVRREIRGGGVAAGGVAGGGLGDDRGEGAGESRVERAGVARVFVGDAADGIDERRADIVGGLAGEDVAGGGAEAVDIAARGDGGALS